MNEKRLLRMESQLDALIERIHELEQENSELRVREHQWASEKMVMMHKNDTAREKIKSLIAQLRKLEVDCGVES